MKPKRRVIKRSKPDPLRKKGVWRKKPVSAKGRMKKRFAMLKGRRRRIRTRRRRVGMRRKKIILAIDHFVPHYDMDTGSRNTYQYLTLFADMGLKVRFAGYDFTRYEPYTSDLENKGIKVISGQFDRLVKWLKRYGKRVKYAYICRPHVGMKFMDVIRKYTRAKIIYNSVDFGFLRELRRFEIEQNAEILAYAEELKRWEYGLFSKSDVVFTVSEYEKTLLQQDMPNKRIIVIPTYFYSQELPLGIPNNFENRTGIAFVGGFNHSPNSDGVLWFVQDILPLIRMHLPDTMFTIIGSSPSPEIMGLRSDNIQVTGYIPDEELQRYYSLTRVMVAPLRFGAGVKGKIIEAIAYATPIVTTSIGIEGIKDPAEVVILAESNEQFAAQVIDLYHNPERWQHIRNLQIEYANRYLHVNYAKEVLKEVLQV